MGLRIFLAGAAGAIGRPLSRLLRDSGHSVVGTTRTLDGKAKLEAFGIEAAVVDVFDREALGQAVKRAAPEIVIHQLTDLAAGLDPKVRDETLKRNARLRREGTANLVRAAKAAGARRLVAQSIAWAYAPKETPWREDDPLDVDATGLRAISVRDGVIPLENAVLAQDGFEGLVLRYGQLYGPGTWSAEPKGDAPVHVEAAAHAAFLAVSRGRPAAYNIADPGGAVAIDRAVTELGWRPEFRLGPHG
jgi:nucleoside-diphosphate-sugar epimerase